MTQKVVTKQELYKQLNSLLKDFEVIGPKELPNKGIFYETVYPVRDFATSGGKNSISNGVNKAEELYLGEGFTIEPVKKFFLGPSEWLFKCQYKDRKNSLEDVLLPNNKRIIIGVRPCEARGLMLLDKVFDPLRESEAPLSKVEGVDAEYKDDFYINNRRRTIIIGLSCVKPDRACFCTSMGGSPIESRGMDVIILSKEDEFIIEIITDKGKEIFGGLGQDFSEMQRKSYESEKEKRKELVRAKIKIPEVLGKIFENAYWEQVSRPCLSCGICTFLCPTCHCFDLVDEERKRLRCYDGCAFPDFTVQASGENPRPTKRERYRQRVFHKFDYFKKNFGENLCIGCGRCIRYCPVKIDIAEIVANAPIS